MKQFGPDRDQSEFNMGISWLSRINYLLFYANHYSTQSQHWEWFHHLNAVYRELITNCKKEIPSLNPMIAELFYLFNIQKKTNSPTIQIKLYHKLDAYHKELITVMDKAGILTKKKDDPGLATG